MENSYVENPYAAGSYVPTAEENGIGIDPDLLITATMGQRFGNLMLDGIFMQVLLYGYLFGGEYLIGLIAEFAPSVSAFLYPIFNLSQVPLFFGGTSILYFTVFEGFLQRSPAKFLTGTMVVTKEGESPSLLQIIGRSFARLIPFEIFSIFFSDELRTWHDSLSGTKVVRVGDITP